MIRISVLVPALLGTAHVARLLEALNAQTARDQLELLILCPSAQPWSTVPLQPQDRILEVGPRLLHQARALGVEAAQGEWVLLAEDHCLPEATWAEAVLQAAGPGWDAVGPGVTSGNPRTALARAQFLLGYGQWYCPKQSGPVAYVCGCNSILRRSALRQFGQHLADELLLPAYLQVKLKGYGSHFWLEAGARMKHFDGTQWRGALPTIFLAGVGFGAQRTRTWSPAARSAYALATPAIGALHFRRAWRQYHSVARDLGMPALLLALPLAMVWGLGEACGSLLGPARVASWISACELGRWNYVCAQDLPA